MFKIAYGAGHNNATSNGIPRSLDPSGTNEWVLNDRIARYFAQAAKAYPEVQLLRVDDPAGLEPTVLKNRVDKANAWGADFFLAIHHNGGINGGTGGGLVAFSYKEGTKAAEYRDSIYNACLADGGIRGDRWKGTLTDNLYVLRHTNMPAVLMEYGFMDSVTDVPIILTEEFAKAQAYATMEGIAKIAGLKKKQIEPKPEPEPEQKPDEVPEQMEVYSLNFRNIRNGDRGDDVKALQILISGAGIYCDPDGIFGSQTEKAVKQYQQKNELPLTGFSDKETMESLLGLKKKGV